MKKKLKRDMEVRKAEDRGIVVGFSALTTLRVCVMWELSGRRWEYKHNLRIV